jgi:hypothetical protein
VYDNSRKATIHDAALWSCELLMAKRAMLGFAVIVYLMMMQLNRLNEIVQLEKNICLVTLSILCPLQPSSS